MSQKQYTVGFVGAGNIIGMHMDGLVRFPERFNVVAACDINPETLQTHCDKYNIPNRYDSVEAMLAGETLDIAIVITATHVRKDILLTLMDAGVAIFCEKPLAETYEEAVEIASEATRRNIKMSVDQNFRNHFAFELAKDALATGELGKPLHWIQVVQSKREDIAWRMQRPRYVMSVMGIHWLDGYRYLFGCPKSIYCKAALYETAGESAVSMILDYEDGLIVSLCETFNTQTWYRRATLDCEHGMLEMDYGNLKIIDEERNETVQENPYDKPGAVMRILLDLADAIENDTEPFASVQDNLLTMRMMEAAYRSIELGRPVTVEEITA